MNSDSLDNSDSSPYNPNDSLVIIYLMWAGGSSCISWACVINAIDYFAAKFANNDVSFIFPRAPYVAQLTTTLVITQISNFCSYGTRIITSVSILTFMTALIPLEAALFNETAFGMNLIMILLFIMGFNSTLCYASVGGLTSQIEGKYTAYCLIGVAVCGLVMNLLRELTLIIFNPSSDGDVTCIFVYFGIAVILLSITLMLHAKFMNSEFYSKNFANSMIVQGSTKATETPLMHSNGQVATSKKNLKTMLEVCKKTKLYLFLFIVACIQHNLLYPGVMLKKPIPWMANHTKTVSMVMTYSIFFIFGKKCGQYRKYYNVWTAIVVAIIRLVLIAFFILQVVTVTIPIFNTAWFGYVNIALFGITFGFLNVSLFIMSPEQVTKDKKEIAGFLSSFWINLGTMLGAFLSLSLKNLGP
jgi:hypothetical protein